MHWCFCCLQDKTWIKMPILWNYCDALTNFLTNNWWSVFDVVKILRYCLKKLKILRFRIWLLTYEKQDNKFLWQKTVHIYKHVFYAIIFPYPDLHGLFLIYLSYMQKKTNERRHAWNLKKSKLLFSFFFGFFMINNYLQMVGFHNYVLFPQL